MEVKEKTIQTLVEIADKLQTIKSDWCIIGASAMILSDIGIDRTSDIDILTTKEGAVEWQLALREYMEINPVTKESNLFRSNFARFNLSLMDIEVMGGLQVNKNGKWNDVHVDDFHEISIGNMIVKTPTPDEQKRILLLFGRDKDLKQ